MAASASNEAPTQPVEAAWIAHLGAALGCLHRLLLWNVAVTRQLYGPVADDAYRGLYVPDGEIERLQTLYPPLPDELVHQRDALYAEWNAIEAQAVAAVQAGADIPLIRLAVTLGLGTLERAVLLLALAPEIDLRFEKLFAYIQDDVTRKRPAVDLALRLFCPEPRERLLARAVFAPDAPLLRHRLIQLADDNQRPAPLIGRFIRLDDRIAAALLAQPAIDPLLESCLSLERPRRALSDLMLPADLITRLEHLLVEHPAGLVFGLQGGYGSGRRAVAEALCAQHGLHLICVDFARLADAEVWGGTPADATRRIVREARLHGAALLWTGANPILADDGPSGWRHALLAALAEPGLFSFLALSRPWEAHGNLGSASYLRLALPTLSYSERERIWERRLGAHSPGPGVIRDIASTFRLSGGQIRDAAIMAHAVARWQGLPPEALLSAPILAAACRAQASGKLDALAHKIPSTYNWADIVLPPDQISQLREICIQVRHRRTVLEQWGFDRRLAMGKGVNVLFAGQSGTGKTMAAEIIAADLGLELFKVDLSTLVSKYIGETEKNLDKIFTAAREANAILFFDEADAIFGKRSEVKDAHDRYANIEVGYLLQKMEEYDGVVILATNLKKNMDDAFVRRLHTTIDFPFPEEADRLRIWRGVFPTVAPLAGDVNLAFLARQFKLAGGNIRNIALLAAYLAAEDGAVIGMSHVIRAVRREYQKLGKLLTEAEFGPYLALARSGEL